MQQQHQLIPPQRLRRARIANLQLQLEQLHRREQVVVAALLADEVEGRVRRRQRTCWVKPWLQHRVLLGQYDNLLQELMRESQGDLKNYLRMEMDMFLELVARVSPRITKSSAYSLPICPGLKLAVTLRFLATGNSYASLSYSFRVSQSTISIFVPEVCDAIVEEYVHHHFATPSNPDEWGDVAGKFASRWNFPRACGALDGKHVAIRKQPHGGSRFYNYKGYHSIVTMALVDAEYNFLWANVGRRERARMRQFSKSAPYARAYKRAPWDFHPQIPCLVTTGTPPTL
ncbi:uncharacterized protein LOC118408322 [Branchiostoma floridae]|uniref:Uncharacterized protein LOC118408322 n=1 Tax=Branchiostoma floridae TaxID=7739 RepID=A0A9J7HVJ4_BRAFL|nr:uncharacterized protein LOC118408322 [Branchiostoma floridae]